MNHNILWLASWYPNILTPYDGDFVQRHARAVALFQKITVIHVKKDDEGTVTGDVKEIIAESGNLSEIIVFYHPRKTGFSSVDKVLSAIKYKRTYMATLNKYLRENGKPDLVHVHVALKAGQQALWLRKKFTIPFILSEHWTGYFQESDYTVDHLNPLQQRTLKRIFSKAEKLIVVSDVLGKVISKYFWQKQYEIIFNTVDTTIFFPIEDKTDHLPRFIHISSLNYQKNPLQIIESFYLLKKKGHDFSVEIFGPVKKDLQEEVNAKGLKENVAFKNEVPQPVLAETLRKADALVLFSHYETFGCVVIEANACGVPAILADLPVFKEFVEEGLNCVIAKANDAEDLAQKLEMFVLNRYKFDKEKIAKDAAEKFSYRVIGKQFMELYDDILNEDLRCCKDVL